MTVPEPFPQLRPAGDALGGVYVSRLERLVRLRRDFEEHLNGLGITLLDRSIFATLRDCMESGAGDKARILMQELSFGPGTFGLDGEDGPRG
jgi:hypothetical protein